jgi:hypothetical protein
MCYISYVHSGIVYCTFHIMWVPVTLAHSQVVDGDDGLHMWRIGPNILNKQLTRSGPPALGLGMGLKTPYNRKPTCCKMLHRALGLDGFYE